MIVWHNLLAIWLWRYFVSALEAIGIPGIVSILGLLLYYIPTYFLWMTGFFFLMLITKKIGSKEYVSSFASYRALLLIPPRKPILGTLGGCWAELDRQLRVRRSQLQLLLGHRPRHGLESLLLRLKKMRRSDSRPILLQQAF
jgi:hypothetical protein